MDLLELRYFLTIAEAGSLSAAAVRLGVSQTALTRQMRTLEADLHVELFYRHGRGVSLTDAGRRLQAAGSEALHRLDAVKAELASRSSRVTGSIALGLPPSIAATIGARLATKLAERYPEAQLLIREAFSGVLVEWVEGRRLDLAVLDDARRGPSMPVTPLLLEKLFLIVPAIAAPASPATLAELATYPMVLPGTENGLRRVIDAACRLESVRPRIAMQLDCVAALKQVVEEGRGHTILPYGAVHREVRDGRLAARPFREAGMRAMLVIATPSQRPVTRLAKLLAELVRAEVRELADGGVLRGTTRGLGQKLRAASARACGAPRLIRS
jgi:LysR family nitrogen assimilation transcriptional regulator